MNLPDHIKLAIDTYIPSYEGWATPEYCCEMASRIIETNAQVCVDIGIFAGRSTIAMGFAARQLTTAKVYGIDPWMPEVASDNDDSKEGVDWWKDKANLEEMQRQAVRAIWDHHLEDWVSVIRAKSEHVYQLFPTIGFLNIDGGHSEVASCKDVELYLPRLRPNHYLTFDDTAWPSTQKALKLVEEQCELVNVIQGKTESRTYRKKIMTEHDKYLANEEENIN